MSTSSNRSDTAYRHFMIALCTALLVLLAFAATELVRTSLVRLSFDPWLGQATSSNHSANGIAIDFHE